MMPCIYLVIIGASLSEPHTSVTALHSVCVSIYGRTDHLPEIFKSADLRKFVRAGNFKSANLRNLYVHVGCEREIEPSLEREERATARLQRRRERDRERRRSQQIEARQDNPG